MKPPSFKKKSIDKPGNKGTIIQGKFQSNHDEDVELLSEIRSNLNEAKSKTPIKVTSLISANVASPLARSTTPIKVVFWTPEENTLRSPSE